MPDLSDLKLTLIQSVLAWQDAVANRAHFEQVLAPLAGQTDLVVLPEMFTTGFTMAPELLAEAMEGETLQWMRRQARQIGAVLCGSVAISSGSGFYNRLLWVEPNGQVRHYDKRHLFRMGNEQEHYAAGSEPVIFHYRGWRIRPIVCYDLRFPVWCRNRNDYDVLVCVANWPAPRRHPWRTLLQARAIENQCYVAGVNRIGRDGKGLDYSGDSLLVDFIGELRLDAAPGEAFVKTHTLSLDELHTFRARFPAWQDADNFSLQI